MSCAHGAPLAAGLATRIVPVALLPKDQPVVSRVEQVESILVLPGFGTNGQVGFYRARLGGSIVQQLACSTSFTNEKCQVCWVG